LPLPEILVFFAMVILISFSGVLLPGPMTAATIVKSYSDKWAGAKVAVGHAVVEMPLLAVIALGASAFIEENPLPIQIIGLIGGGYLLFFGITILRDESFISEDSEQDRISRNAFTLGITTTLLNPGFLIWWATIGILLITQAAEYGLLILIIFAIVHWLSDFSWGLAISFGIQKVKEFYASKVRTIIRYSSAVLILIFGIYFAIISGYALLS